MKRRNWSSDEKLAIVLTGIRGEKTVSEICREYQISQSVYYKWRDKFLDGGKNALSNSTNGNNRHNAEIERLQKIIGKQTIQIDVLKKTSNL